MVKPPPMLTADTRTAAAASACTGVSGSRPPPQSIMPPTTVRPEMALVTDMSGLCSACVTPRTCGAKCVARCGELGCSRLV
eukprot:357785-Chlamydomonas_euryale.AAC.1